MELNLQHYTAKQYAVILLREDFGYSHREISEKIGLSQTAVRHILNKIRR